MRERDWIGWKPGRPARIDLGARVISHRGAAAYAPENTLAGICAAYLLRARWVEFDVKLSRDGVPVLIHDEKLERTTSGAGEVRDHDLAQLLELDAGSWLHEAFTGEGVPTMEAAVRLALTLGIETNIEIKPSPGREEETAAVVARELQRIWPEAHPAPLISSFSVAVLQTLQKQAPILPRMLLAHRIPGDWREILADLECVAFNVNEQALNPEVLATFREEGVPVLSFTVNDAERARVLVDAGVRAIVTDVPDVIAKAIGENQYLRSNPTSLPWILTWCGPKIRVS